MKKSFALLVTVLTIAGISAMGCKDEEESGSSADSSAVVSALDNPTGTVATPEDAKGVAAAFTETMSAMGGSLGGATESQTMECPAGGNYEITATGTSQTDMTMDFSYNNCCMSEANCCMDGSGWYTAGSGNYTFCYSYNMTMDCGESSGNIVVSYCIDAAGSNWYVVEYSGATYAVSGSYTSGVGGTWTVRDANTTWECTEDYMGVGSCTDGTTTINW